MRILVTGGGTGGHVYPALSVAQELGGDEVLFAGSAAGPEARIVPAAGLEFVTVPSAKVAGKGPAARLRALCAHGAGVAFALRLLRRRRPDVILGTGGYASAGVVAAGCLLRIPTVLHEANAVPGRTNRLLGRFSRLVALTYPSTASYFPAGRSAVTGMPVRRELRDASPVPAQREYALDPDLPTLVICGGSGGARSINRAVVAALPQLGEMGIQVVHQTGPGLYEEVTEAVPGTPAWYRPVPYVDRMHSLLAAGDLIVCRGGSSTLAEAAVAGLPAIVIPYPHAIDDHQSRNAEAAAAAGAAIVIPDRELDGPALSRAVGELVSDRVRLLAMAEAARMSARPHAAAQLARIVRAAGRGEDPLQLPATLYN